MKVSGVGYNFEIVFNLIVEKYFESSLRSYNVPT